ncbi:AAA family ATPase [Rhodococcus sp. NPDC077669]|uniref:AAA family ATPase n=1 Tax=Rhodococcus sp. NPDC077669 TaxID=3155174 RepID=UPI0034473F6C
MIEEIGKVKIARRDLRHKERPLIGNKNYDSLPDECYSLGQSDEYYENLKNIGQALGGAVREDILKSMRDIAFDLRLFEETRQYESTQVSLLRSWTARTVRHQLNRIAHGGRLKDRYFIKYTFPAVEADLHPPTLDFKVDPDSQPASNIHVIIGRNGAGKTTLFRRISLCFLDPGSENIGTISDAERPQVTPVVNLVSVAFSAFDPFEPVDIREYNASISYNYVGLRKELTSEDGSRQSSLKDTDELALEFVDSLDEIISAGRVETWLKAIEHINNDANFAEYELSSMVSIPRPANRASERATIHKRNARRAFRKMSSGHKIVLLTLSRLVHLVEERSLILIDEPESHLHPPLLAAFIRALSDLLDTRNGIAFIATHSPVVLQEVPASCVSILRRYGDLYSVHRPETETFGEAVGVLTHGVFDLEVQGSGFHKEISRAVERYTTYEEVMASFGGQVGGEGRALIRVLLNAKLRNENRR